MNFTVKERSVLLAQYIVDNNTTVRNTSKHFGISKSTVHKDVTQKLYMFNPSLFEQTREVLDTNKAERHIRGGLATKNKKLKK